MTPEEVKKRFEKAIEAMFASASRQLGDIENKTPDVIDSLHLMGSAMKESLSTTALSGPSLNCWKSSKMLKKVALVMVLVMAALV